MNIEPDQPHCSNRKKTLVYAALIITTIIGLLLSIACFIIGILIAGGILLGAGMSGESVLHSDPNPNNTIVVHVISGSCGATCGCTTWLNISQNQKTEKEIYYVIDACDLDIKWLDNYRFEVIDKSRESDEPVIIDARDYFRFDYRTQFFTNRLKETGIGKTSFKK